MNAAIQMNALSQGFYTSREAANLIEVGNLRRIKNWLDGYPGSKSGPLLHRDFHGVKKGDPQELSFFDLIEVRFVEFFRQQEVRMRTLRAALDVAREKFGERPFASNKVRFHVSDDKQIYVQETDQPIASSKEDPKFWNLIKQQYEMVEVLHKIIEKGLIFDPQTERAKIWRPRAEKYPLILIDPRQAYGKPIVESGIPTSTIYYTWMAERQDYGFVREWYGITPAETKDAVAFEMDLRSKKEVRVA